MKKRAMVVLILTIFTETISTTSNYNELASASSHTWKSTVEEIAFGGLGVLAAVMACDRGGIAPVTLCAASAAVLGNSMTTEDALNYAAFTGTMVFVLPKVLPMSNSDSKSIEMLAVVLTGRAAFVLAKKGFAKACTMRDRLAE
jgi:hypothetical protein